MEDGELILIDEVLTPDSSRFKISKENETGLNVVITTNKLFATH